MKKAASSPSTPTGRPSSSTRGWGRRCGRRSRAATSSRTPTWRLTRTSDRNEEGRLSALHADRAAFFIRARLGPALREKVQSCDVLQDAYLAAHKDFRSE